MTLWLSTIHIRNMILDPKFPSEIKEELRGMMLKYGVSGIDAARLDLLDYPQHHSVTVTVDTRSLT